MPACPPCRKKRRLSSLRTPVQFLKGVGPQRAELLAKLDLHYAADVLFFFPRAYQDMSELREIDQLEEGKLASVVGVIEEVDLRNTGPGKSHAGHAAQAGDAVSPLPVVQSAVDAGEAGRGAADSWFRASRSWKGMRWEMVHPRVELLADDEDAPGGPDPARLFADRRASTSRRCGGS